MRHPHVSHIKNKPILCFLIPAELIICLHNNRTGKLSDHVFIPVGNEAVLWNHGRSNCVVQPHDGKEKSRMVGGMLTSLGDFPLRGLSGACKRGSVTGWPP